MNKCRHCGTFVPVEKAFCPNCSEPMEPEDAPNRAASSSSDMIATLRDDPEHYREVLEKLKQKKAAAEAAATAAPQPPADQARAAPSVIAFKDPQIAPSALPPPAENNKRTLVLIISVILILVIIVALLLFFKVF